MLKTQATPFCFTNNSCLWVKLISVNTLVVSTEEKRKAGKMNSKSCT